MTGGVVASTLATLTLNGNAIINANATTASLSSDIDLNGGTRTFTVANGTAATDVTISAAITNGSLTKSGLGTMRLTGSTSNTATTTTVLAGTLELNKTSGISAIGGSALVVGDGAGTDVVRYLASRPDHQLGHRHAERRHVGRQRVLRRDRHPDPERGDRSATPPAAAR